MFVQFARDFQRFINGLKILRSLDQYEVPGVDWPRFRDDPYEYFISAPPDQGATIYAAILRREPKASGPQGRTTAWRTRCWYCRTRVDAVTEKAVPGWVGQHPLCDSCSQTVRS